MNAAFEISAEVRAALAEARPVVALETSVIGQGLPFPRNLECVERMNAAIRGSGSTPAWIGVMDGSVTVGLTAGDLTGLARSAESTKVARRDYPVAVATGALGATTVSATVWAAARAGINVSATGGIGGVHPVDGDVSADLIELGRTPGLLVCSGPKSIVDPAATADKLEELGVVLVGYGVDKLPFFLARECSVELEHRVEDPQGAASLLRAALALETSSTLLLCNPVPEGLDPQEVAAAVAVCQERADREGVHGKALTPFLLAALAEETQGRSLEVNLDLLEANARLAGQIARAAIK